MAQRIQLRSHHSGWFVVVTRADRESEKQKTNYEQQHYLIDTRQRTNDTADGSLKASHIQQGWIESSILVGIDRILLSGQSVLYSKSNPEKHVV